MRFPPANLLLVITIVFGTVLFSIESSLSSPNLPVSEGAQVLNVRPDFASGLNFGRSEVETGYLHLSISPGVHGGNGNRSAGILGLTYIGENQRADDENSKKRSSLSSSGVFSAVTVSLNSREWVSATVDPLVQGIFSELPFVPSALHIKAKLLNGRSISQKVRLGEAGVLNNKYDTRKRAYTSFWAYPQQLRELSGMLQVYKDEASGNESYIVRAGCVSSPELGWVTTAALSYASVGDGDRQLIRMKFDEKVLRAHFGVRLRNNLFDKTSAYKGSQLRPVFRLQCETSSGMVIRSEREAISKSGG